MRVVVTGMGAISCVGNGVSALRESLLSCTSGIAPFGTAWGGYPADSIAGVVRTVPQMMVPRGQVFLDAAFSEALGQAGFNGSLRDAHLYLGTIHGNFDQWSASTRRSGVDAKLPWDFPNQLSDWDIEPSNTTFVSTACTASSVAIGLALDSLRLGITPVAIAAGVEVMTPFLHGGFASLRALSTKCRPFDQARSGLVLGEGAAAVVLETEEHARRRGAVVNSD